MSILPIVRLITCFGSVLSSTTLFPAGSSVHDVNLSVLIGSYPILKVFFDLARGPVSSQIVDIYSTRPSCAVVALAGIGLCPHSRSTGVIGFRVHVQSGNVDEGTARDSVEVDCHRGAFDGERVAVS